MKKVSAFLMSNVSWRGLYLYSKFLQVFVLFILVLASTHVSEAGDKAPKSREIMILSRLITPSNKPIVQQEVCLQFVNDKDDIILKIKKDAEGNWDLKGDCGTTDTQGDFIIKSQIEPNLFLKCNNRTCIKFGLNMGMKTIIDKETNKPTLLSVFIDDNTTEIKLPSIVTY